MKQRSVEISPSSQSWAANRDVADEVLAHPFVRGLGDGSLPHGVFADYVAQDVFFLECFAISGDTPTVLALADLIAGVRTKLGLYNSYAVRWKIDTTTVEPVPATLAYTEFVLATAATGSLGAVFAAMTPCMRLYAWLGAKLKPSATGDYVQWVDTYGDPGFEESAVLLERLLDEHADDTPAIRTAYRHAMQLEHEFCDAAMQEER